MADSCIAQDNYQAINTFSRRPSVPQIISYIVILAQLLTFYMIAAPALNSKSLKLGLIIAFSISLVGIFVTTFLSSYIDPSDSILILERKGQLKMIRQNLAQYLYCDHCRSYVSQSARHCRVCHRCVEHFDHHCIWINNCIGSKNYKVFFAMIISTFVNMSIFIATIACLTAQYAWKSYVSLMIVNWVVLALICVLTFLIVNLIILHIYLSCKGYTTYQFIMMRRQHDLQAQQKKAQQQIERRRRQLQRQLSVEMQPQFSNNQSQIKQERKGYHLDNNFKSNKNNHHSNKINNDSSKQTQSVVNQQQIKKIVIVSKHNKQNSNDGHQQKRDNCEVIFGNQQNQQYESNSEAHQAQCNYDIKQEEEKKKKQSLRFDQFMKQQTSDINIVSDSREEIIKEKKREEKQKEENKKEERKIQEKKNVRNKHSKTLQGSIREKVGQSLKSWEKTKIKQDQKRRTNQNFHIPNNIMDQQQKDEQIGEQIHISRFFTRNKSLNILITDEYADTPSKVNGERPQHRENNLHTTRAKFVISKSQKRNEIKNYQQSKTSETNPKQRNKKQLFTHNQSNLHA